MPSLCASARRAVWQLTAAPEAAAPTTQLPMQDYDKTPIGFGIVVFCIAKAPDP